MSHSPKQHRLPLRFIDGAFELQIGGAVPMFDGTLCELVVTEDKISDPKLLESPSVKKSIKILGEGPKTGCDAFRQSRRVSLRRASKGAIADIDLAYRHMGKSVRTLGSNVVSSRLC